MPLERWIRVSRRVTEADEEGLSRRIHGETSGLRPATASGVEWRGASSPDGVVDGGGPLVPGSSLDSCGRRIRRPTPSVRMASSRDWCSSGDRRSRAEAWATTTSKEASAGAVSCSSWMAVLEEEEIR